jgi:hypothetical protein
MQLGEISYSHGTAAGFPIVMSPGPSLSIRDVDWNPVLFFLLPQFFSLPDVSPMSPGLSWIFYLGMLYNQYYSTDSNFPTLYNFASFASSQHLRSGSRAPWNLQPGLVTSIVNLRPKLIHLLHSQRQVSIPSHNLIQHHQIRIRPRS